MANEKATTKELKNNVSGKQLALEQAMKLMDRFRDQSDELKIALGASQSRVKQKEASERGKDKKIVNLTNQLKIKMNKLKRNMKRRWRL